MLRPSWIISSWRICCLFNQMISARSSHLHQPTSSTGQLVNMFNSQQVKQPASQKANRSNSQFVKQSAGHQVK
jgi:hypothetical protein